jgi:cytochrome P450
MHAHLETGDEPLTIEELISMFHVFLMAGHDTTRQTLANGMRILATDAELFAQLQQHPEQVGSFVEEVIRLYPPAVMTPRVAAEDTEIDGVAIPKGATVFLCWGSGNRDAEVFHDPDQFKCPNEAGKDHLGFGHGEHFCVGNRLARTTLATAFGAFLHRYAAIALAVPEQDLRYEPMINLRSLTSLPIRCTLKSAA